MVTTWITATVVRVEAAEIESGLENYLSGRRSEEANSTHDM
jgi:hypothetical protein